MSTFKTTVDTVEVHAFLKGRYPDVHDIASVTGGEGSQAFSFKTSEKDYILRVNKSADHFGKDAYAYKHFSSKDVPIPAVLEVGTFNENLAYAISEAARGTRFDLLPTDTQRAIAPQLFQTLSAIHATKIQGSGYGTFDSSGKAEYSTWRASFSVLEKWRSTMTDSSGNFAMQVEEGVWNDVRKEIDALLSYCPEERYLFHGDFGFDNAFSDGNSITAVIDWGNAGYGDFLYDAAWLSYWSRFHARRIQAKEWYTKTDTEITHFDERMRSYELYIGLGALLFYAFSQQRDKYEFNKNILLAVLKE